MNTKEMIKDLLKTLFLLLLNIGAHILLFIVNWKIALAILVLNYTTTKSDKLAKKYPQYIK